MVRNIEVQNMFSGPLDLLLYLVRRDEIDIHDIPVGHVTREYLLELNKMQEIDVDAGGEFLAMASMLTEIKGRMLLPDISTEDEEEDEIYDPRQGLVEALLEYKKFKEVAAELQGMSSELENRYSRIVLEPEFQSVIKEKAEEVGALDLLAAFQRIARKMLNERAPREIVSEEVPTEVRIQQIEEVVALRGRVSFSSILSDSPSEDEMVGFFIAMLELIRMKKIQAQQAIDFSEIYFIPLIDEVDSITDISIEKESMMERVSAVVMGVALSRDNKKRRIFGLSNIFGVSSLQMTPNKISVNPVRSRFDFLVMVKSDRSNIKYPESNRLKHVFPPLLQSGILSILKMTVSESGDESGGIITHDADSSRGESSSVVPRNRTNMRLADIFVWYTGKKESLAGEFRDYISNRFNMLRLQSGRRMNGKFLSIGKHVEFLKLSCGRVCRYCASVSIARVGVASQVSDSSTVSEIIVLKGRVKARTFNLTGIFNLRLHLENRGNIKQSGKNAVSGFLKLKSSKKRVKKNVGRKRSNFLLLGCGGVQKHRIQDVERERPTVINMPKGEIIVEKKFPSAVKSKFGLASALNLQRSVSGMNTAFVVRNLDFMKSRSAIVLKAQRHYRNVGSGKFLGL